MSDDLVLPTVPEPKPDDPEDVSWALSTAEAMWARGDHAEGIKWVRRAAEAASEAESDERALELAKAAADLAALIAKRASRASIDLEEIEPISEAEPAPPPPPPAKPANKPAPPKPAPAAAPKPGPTGMTKPSRPPAPLPSKTSQPPPARASQAPKAAAKPLGTNTGKTTTAAGKSGPESKRRGPRKSRENLDAEARAALNATETAPQPAVDVKTAEKIVSAETAETKTVDVPVIERKRQEEPTLMAHVNDIRPPTKSADEWDIDSTQNLTGDDFPALPSADGDRKTALFPADFKATMHSFTRPGGLSKAAGASTTKGTNPPATVAGALLAQAGAAAGRAAADRHDPSIVTTQAVRVVVWRDSSGVHVAPSGTVVSAITVDAVLVALEPNTDLTAWLTEQKGR